MVVSVWISGEGGAWMGGAFIDGCRMAGRVTVQTTHPRLLFFCRFVEQWRDMCDGEKDKNNRYTLWKALGNMKKYPLEVTTVAELKQINGVGEFLAVRLMAGWDELVGRRGGEEIRVTDVKAMPKTELESLVRATENARKAARKEKASATAADKRKGVGGDDEFTEPAVKLSRRTSGGSASSSQSVVRSGGVAGADDEFIDPDDSPLVPLATTHSQSTDSQTSSSGAAPINYTVTRPDDQAEVILICDSREDSTGRLRGNAKSVVDHLQKKGGGAYRMELRALSVGDYLWVARKIDGSETVLDWVVERKTYADLSQSIVKGRYEEQKQRLARAPIGKRVYLIEGHGRGDKAHTACEQALCTTMVRDGFMIERCSNTQATAKFLLAITERLKLRVRTTEMAGIEFSSLQELAKKTKTECVKDTWTRQLMVCPGMSASRALSVADRFPSLPAMRELYKGGGEPAETRLHTAVPQCGRALSAQMSKFFESA